MKRFFALPALLVAAGLSVTPAAAELGSGEPLTPAKNLSGAFLAAETARTENDFAAAVQYYTEALRFDPDNPGLQQELLLALVTNGEFDKALPIAEELKEEPQIERVSRIVLGIDAIRARRYLKADGSLILTFEGDLERLLTTVMRAWARFGNNEADSALDMLSKLEGPDWYGLFTAYHGALIADAAGKTDTAEELYQYGMTNTAGGSASPQTFIRLGEAYAGFLARHGRGDEAKQALANALAIAPGNPELLALTAEDADLARDALRIADPARGASEILFDLGTAINRDGAENFAALYLEMARVLAPDNAQIYFELGGISERLQLAERAIGYYDQVPEKSPFHDIAQLQKGLNLADIGKAEEAKERIAKRLEAMKDDEEAEMAAGRLDFGADTPPIAPDLDQDD